MERYININDYDYPLPDERIAKFPLAERDSSKLLVYRGGEISEKHFSDIAEECPILYGGSCKPSNAAEIFAKADVDGGLIGGAALKAEDFLAIGKGF